MSDEPKPCPFCGERLEGGDNYHPTAECLLSGWTLPHGRQKDMWNRRASPWQPISTAPKDGTPIVLKRKFVATVGYWHSKHGDWLCWFDPEEWYPIPPLPQPPEQEERSD